jgi:signal transduction histidine kinase
VRGSPRRGALGLRGRIVGALLVSTVVTLAVAAIALLGPLQQSLRNAELKTLRGELGKSATGSFKRLDLTNLPLSSPVGHSARVALERRQQQLASRVGGVVTVLGYPDATGRGQLLLAPSAESDTAVDDPFDDVAAAFRSGRARYSFGSIGATQYVRVALPFKNDGLSYVLAVRKPIDEIPGAVHAVRTAFITAALAGLALTLILGIPLAATLVRRLRRLRQAARQLAEHGTVVDVPVDRARDEVGDLSRTFALMQRQLHQQEQARRAFVATASHELRTPLASLDGMLELLDDDLRGGTLDLDDARLLLERARAQSRRLGRLAADLLDLSRIDADVQLRSEPVELGELSRAVLAEFELGTAERRITSALDDSAGPVWALGDPGSVARIVRILLDNAVRASPEGAEIRVELRDGGQAAVSVCDEGPGVPLQERELIFERFQRGRDTGGEAGFGLGLAIGRELAERMGGELVLEDEQKPGAKFTLRLPVAHAPEHEPAWVS